MILFFDRSVGRHVPEALRAARVPVEVEYHQQHFAPDERDDVWLPIVGRQGWTVISQDDGYHQRETALEAIRQFDIGLFYLWGSDASTWQVLQCFARAYDRIIEAETETDRPFIYSIAQNGRLRRVSLG